mgnify:CR=1 FL=1
MVAVAGCTGPVISNPVWSVVVGGSILSVQGDIAQRAVDLFVESENFAPLPNYVNARNVTKMSCSSGILSKNEPTA